jgi:predicted transcriptional regulator
MKVLDVMKKNVIKVKKENSILEAIKIMKDKNIGFLIIEENDEAIGVITDRDITISMAKEISVNTRVEKIMKKYVITINKESDASTASDMMGYMQVRRLVVVDDNNKIAGVLSLTDLASNPETEELALETLIEISYNYPTKNDTSDNILQVSAYIF